MIQSRIPPAGRLYIIIAVILLCSSAAQAETENYGETAQAFTVPKLVSSLPAAISSKRSLYLEMLEQQARKHAIPVELADAVAFVESAYDAAAIGHAGEVGIMQIMPATAAMLGFVGGQAELADPETNIRLGVQYLAGAWRLAAGDVCHALMKYRAGHGEQAMSARSIEYCRRARDYLAALGSPLARLISVSVASVAALKPEPRVRTTLASRTPTAADRSRRFWAAHEARVRALTITVRAKWARLAQHKRG